MKIAALGSPESWYCRDIQRAVEGRGHEFLHLEYSHLPGRISDDSPPATIIAGNPRINSDSRLRDLAELDGLIVRTMAPGSLEQVVFRMNVLGQLADRGTLVVNPPRAIECAVDKYLTTARLQSNGIPVPGTAVCERSEEAMLWFEQLGGDTVVKPVFGSEGRGIIRVSDPDLAWRTFRTLERLDAVIYQQQFIVTDGTDLRVLVLGDGILGGMQRIATQGFRTNVSQQGQALPCRLSDQEKELAQKACRAVGANFAGVDLIYNRSDCLVLEVNAVPGWRAFRKVTGLDVADRLIDWVETNR